MSAARLLPLLSIACFNEAIYADGYSNGCADGYRCACLGFVCDGDASTTDDYGDGYAAGYADCVEDGAIDRDAGACELD